MHLARDRAQLPVVELLIGGDEREVGVLRDDATAEGGWVIRAGLSDDVLATPSLAGRAVAVAANDVAVPIHDRAVGVDHREDRDACRTDGARRAALPGDLSGLAVPGRREATRAVRPEREARGSKGADRGAAKLLVRIDRVRTTAVVEDDPAGHELDVVPLRRVRLTREELRSDTRRGLEPVDRSAGEADRIDDRIAVADDAGRATADVDV